MRPVLQARPGGIRDSLRRGASQAADAAPTLRYGPAGDSAPSAAAQGGWYDRKVPFRPGKHGPNAPRGVLLGASLSMSIERYQMRSSEIQNHWLVSPLSLVNSLPFRSARSGPGHEAATRTLDGEDRWVWQRLRVWENDCFDEVSELRPWAETTRRSPGAVYPALPMKFGPAQRTLDGAACRRIYLVRAR